MTLRQTAAAAAVALCAACSPEQPVGPDVATGFYLGDAAGGRERFVTFDAARQEARTDLQKTSFALAESLVRQGGVPFGACETGRAPLVNSAKEASERGVHVRLLAQEATVAAHFGCLRPTSEEDLRRFGARPASATIRQEITLRGQTMTYVRIDSSLRSSLGKPEVSVFSYFSVLNVRDKKGRIVGSAPDHRVRYNRSGPEADAALRDTVDLGSRTIQMPLGEARSWWEGKFKAVTFSCTTEDWAPCPSTPHLTLADFKKQPVPKTRVAQAAP